MSVDMFLNTSELEDLTGYRHAKKQAEVLRKNRIPFFLNGRGQPKVSRALIESGGKAPKPAKEPHGWQPAALREQSK